MALDPHGLHRPAGQTLRTIEQAKADFLRQLPAFALIIRATHERGDNQALALAELGRRGLWLTDDQRQQAGLPRKETPDG